ncbi:hypothetical protein JIN84_05135 [Luteolibacter yonseiensis]|uniref:Uncharacterized protein n=1 Tax=Luteolibacter yonseiensis TaxID=1144680 RepID=A0A934V6G0_9BACT|nr:hypothetical protein [Luteolibacter yonseiensis]MBK1814987.1 hypothetical protein [Luteolibacter yonseiensis]
MSSIQLSPSELEDVKRIAARDIAGAVLAGINIEELQLMDIATVSAFTGLPVDRVARSMPIVELGPRSRRVRISDYKAYIAKHIKNPA